ncbi:hypothetical protein [Alicyclobacillus macrosporangiidus]|uniref:hypothetical protein n=1 Tax=Alicyclobacillus macrosporangiidus TaxID=392015 RepID=UPI000496E220|nr:hypothetical protein [Alicyclobacillus macrosporangiidus]MCL6600164.1 hypothetical protein [Alicyclobacillus macrosporangiidus]
MTTRFSLAELAEMMHTRVDIIRLAVDTLAAEGKLTAESFVFGDRNWRIAPTDIKRIQDWIEAKKAAGALAEQPPRRRVLKKQIVRQTDA